MLEFVIEIACEKIDALMRALHTTPDLGEMLRLLLAQLVEFGAELAQQLVEFLFERRTPLEVVDDLEEDEEDGGERGGIDEPRGEMRRVGRRNFLG